MEHNGPVNEMWQRLGIDGYGALAVVVAATAIYFTYVLLMRMWGRQLRSSLSVFSVALVTVAGSVAARAMLGNTPTLAGGAIALGVLFFWERVFRHEWALGSHACRVREHAEECPESLNGEEGLPHPSHVIFKLRTPGILMQQTKGRRIRAGREAALDVINKLSPEGSKRVFVIRFMNRRFPRTAPSGRS